MWPASITGGCLCGKLRYSITLAPDGPDPLVQVCQCIDCRKQSGAFIVSFATFPVATSGEAGTKGFTWTASDTLATYSHTPTTTRSFCQACGSSLAYQWEGPTSIDVMISTLDHQHWSNEELVPYLAKPHRTVYASYEIKGVTDLHGGLFGDEGIKRHEKGTDS
ncbi:Mss4-like protein [Pseudohyphozyma bogoriensis]|nr:Mss4-like protein [Pseudohyphozyma bogoriensis]